MAMSDRLLAPCEIAASEFYRLPPRTLLIRNFPRISTQSRARLTVKRQNTNQAFICFRYVIFHTFEQ